MAGLTLTPEPQPLPRDIRFSWRGHWHTFARLMDTRSFQAACPMCGKFFRIVARPDDIPPGSDKGHTVTFRADGGYLLPTLNPSLVCPYSCGFHVTITDGRATP